MSSTATVSDLLGGGRRSVVRSLALVALVVAAIVAAHTAVDMATQTARFRAVVRDLGVAAPPAFIALTALGVLVCIPALVSIVTGSLAFGRFGGALYSLGGITLGACLAFLLGRYVLHGLGTRLQESRVPMLRALASHRGPLPVIGIRFALPFAPGLDYAIGAAGVSLGHYLLGTSLGLVPRTFALAFFFDILTRSDWMAAAVSDPSLLFLLLLPLIRVGGVLILVRLVAQPAGARGVPRPPTS